MACWGIETVGAVAFGVEYRVVKFLMSTQLKLWIERKPKKRRRMYNCDLHTFLRFKFNRLNGGYGGVMRLRDYRERSTKLIVSSWDWGKNKSG